MFSKNFMMHANGFGSGLTEFRQYLLEPSCSILSTTADKQNSQKSTGIKTVCVLSMMSRGRMMN
jgi:hypothetical protein